jgi:iron complex outermembrane receptor protein
MFDSGIALSLIAENILDKNYADHLSGLNRVAETDIPSGAKLPSAGRNIGVFVSYQF